MSDVAFDPELFGRLAVLEPASFWFRARNRLVLSLLRRYAPEARTFLDVGCGTGFVLAALAGAAPALELTGVDAHEEALRTARERVPGARLLVADARALPFEHEFDVAGAFDVLEHVDDDGAVLRGIRRSLRPGGIALLLVPQHPWLWGGLDDLAGHQRRYRRGELLGRIRAAGLEPVRTTSWVTLLLPALALSRRFRSRDPLAALEPPRPLNAAAERVLDFERRLIEQGVDLPAGGTLVAVARTGNG